MADEETYTYSYSVSYSDDGEEGEYTYDDIEQVVADVFRNHTPTSLPVLDDNNDDEEDDTPCVPDGAVHRAPSLPASSPLLSTVTGFPSVLTTHDVFQTACASFSSRPYVGTPSLSPEGKVVYTWETYGEIKVKADAFGNALSARAISVLGIMAVNTPEYLVAERGAAGVSAVVVPLYDTLGPEILGYCTQLVGAHAVLAQHAHLEALISTRAAPFVIAIAEHVDDNIVSLGAAAGVEIVTMAQFLAEGLAAPPEAVGYRPPRPTDIARINFTSGTTSRPKGVMLTHGAIVATLAGAVDAGFDIRHTDVHVSYLPLAHVFEAMVQVGITLHGAAIGFYRGSTKTLVDDIKAVRPTVFCSVPRLLEKIADSITSKATGAPGCVGSLKAKLFAKAMAAKTKKMSRPADPSLKHGLFDALVFKKARAALGGRVRLMVTGSAPLAPSVISFLRIAFSCDVVEGYGQTESCAAVTLTPPGDYSTGGVGFPLPSAEIALATVSSMGWYAVETEEDLATVRASVDPKARMGGEVCIRGPQVFPGYFKNPGKTGETLDAQGWLHTGDIGSWLPSGQLAIVDRKKSFFKLSQGEYVSPEKIEAVLGRIPLVAQSWVTGRRLAASLVALVVPEEEPAFDLANAQGIPGESLEALCESDAFRDAVMELIRSSAKEVGAHGKPQLASFEIPGAIFLLPSPLTPDQHPDLLTPTFKLKRSRLASHFADQVDQAYTRNPYA